MEKFVFCSPLLSAQLICCKNQGEVFEDSVCEDVSFARSKVGHSRNAEDYLGKPSVIEPSQLVNFLCLY